MRVLLTMAGALGLIGAVVWLRSRKPCCAGCEAGTGCAEASPDVRNTDTRSKPGAGEGAGEEAADASGAASASTLHDGDKDAHASGAGAPLAEVQGSASSTVERTWRQLVAP